MEDEIGDRWFLMTGDPGWPLVSRLQSSGLSYLVLPRRSITTGEVKLTDTPSVANLERLGTVYTETSSPGVAKSLIRTLRLRECLEVLRVEAEDN